MLVLIFIIFFSVLSFGPQVWILVPSQCEWLINWLKCGYFLYYTICKCSNQFIITLLSLTKLHIKIKSLKFIWVINKSIQVRVSQGQGWFDPLLLENLYWLYGFVTVMICKHSTHFPKSGCELQFSKFYWKWSLQTMGYSLRFHFFQRSIPSTNFVREIETQEFHLNG